jgi:hypothetical protein
LNYFDIGLIPNSRIDLTLLLTAFFLHFISQPRVAFSLVVQVAYNLDSDKSSPHMVGERLWFLIHRLAGGFTAVLPGPLTQPLLTHITLKNILIDRNRSR